MRTKTYFGEPLRRHDEFVYSMAVDEDGQRGVSVSWDSTLRIWDAKTGECVGLKCVGQPLKGHGDFVDSVGYKCGWGKNCFRLR